jgi:hypothetical protein
MPRIELDLYRRKYFVRTRYVRAFEFENATRKHHEGEGNHAMHDATYSTEPIILCIILNSYRAKWRIMSRLSVRGVIHQTSDRVKIYNLSCAVRKSAALRL